MFNLESGQTGGGGRTGATVRNANGYACIIDDDDSDDDGTTDESRASILPGVWSCVCVIGLCVICNMCFLAVRSTCVRVCVCALCDTDLMRCMRDRATWDATHMSLELLNNLHNICMWCSFSQRLQRALFHLNIIQMTHRLKSSE